MRRRHRTRRLQQPAQVPKLFQPHIRQINDINALIDRHPATRLNPSRMRQSGAQPLREPRHVLRGQENPRKLGVLFPDLGEVFRADFGEDVDHDGDAVDVAAAGPLRLDAVHAAEAVDVGVVVGAVEGGFAAPGGGGGVLLVGGWGVVVAGVEEAAGGC